MKRTVIIEGTEISLYVGGVKVWKYKCVSNEMVNSMVDLWMDKSLDFLTPEAAKLYVDLVAGVTRTFDQK